MYLIGVFQLLFLFRFFIFSNKFRVTIIIKAELQYYYIIYHTLL